MKKLLNYIRARRRKRRAESSRPIMIYGVDVNGVRLPLTRIGSHTSIVGEANLDLANDVFIGQFNFIEASNGIKISEGCQITNYISILSHSSHQSIRLYGKEYRTQSDLKAYVKGKVEIGKYSFIGPHSTILPNTKIGKGSIVSAYSMVKGDFPDFAIIAGNPAKVVGDTRDKDKEWLEKHPELTNYYEQWAKD